VQQLTPQWIARITPDQIRLLNGNFFNALSEEQVNALTPEQVSCIQPSVINELRSEFFNSLVNLHVLSTAQIEALTPEQISCINPVVINELIKLFFLYLTPWQIQAFTQQQLRNISIDIITDESIFYRLYNLTDQQMKEFTEEQIYAILAASGSYYKFIGFRNGLLYSLSSYIIHRLLYVLGQDGRIGAIPENVIRAGGNSLISNLGRFSYLLTPTQRERLSSSQREIVEKSVKYWHMMQGADWTPEAIAQTPPQQLVERLRGLPIPAFVSMTQQQFAAIPALVFREVGEDFWEKILANVFIVDMEYLIRSWTREQIAEIPIVLEALALGPSGRTTTRVYEQHRIMPLYALSPDAIPGIPLGEFERYNNRYPRYNKRYSSSDSTSKNVSYQNRRGWELNMYVYPQWTLTQIAAFTPAQAATLRAELFDGGYEGDTEDDDFLDGNSESSATSDDSDTEGISERREHIRHIQAVMRNINPAYIVSVNIYISSILNHALTPEALNALLSGAQGQTWIRYISMLNRDRIESLLPSTIREIRYRGFFESLTQEQLSWLSPAQLSVLPDFIFTTWDPDTLGWEDTIGIGTSVELSDFIPSQLPDLNPAVFGTMPVGQLNRLNEEQLQSLTNEQIRKIPPGTFEQMTQEELSKFYRNLTEDQRNNLTPDQLAVFKRVMGEAAPGSTTDRRSPPPSGGDGSGGSGGGRSGGSGSAGGGASGGGARPKDPNFMAKHYGLNPGSGKRKKHAPFLPLEYIRKAPAEFWNEYAGPKIEFRTVSYTVQGLPIVEANPIDLEEYQGWIQELRRDQIQSIPPAVISKLNREVAQAFSAQQILWMSLEQRKAFTVGFIEIEPELRELLGISRSQSITINGEQISSSRRLVPMAYEALLNQVDGKQIQQRFSPERIRNLAKNSFLLPFLKPNHIIQIATHDLSPSQIQAFGEKIITEIWGAEYFNRLVPDQRKGILPYISKIKPEVIAKWEARCFEYQEENPLIHENYRNQTRKFTKKQIAAIAPGVIAVLGPRFFCDYLSPEQVRMLSREQIQAISECTLSQLPATWFYDLMEEKQAGEWNTRRIRLLTENQVKAMPVTFFSKFGEKANKRVALQFLEGMGRFQVQALSQEHLDAMSPEDFNLLSANFLNKLNSSQIETRTPEQIAALGVLLLPAIKIGFIASLTAVQAKALNPQQIVAFTENQIRALENKINALHSGVYGNVKAVNRLLLYGSIQQLRLLSKEQTQKADLTKIPVKAFEQASLQKGEIFINFFKEQLIVRQNIEYRNVIPNKVYAQLINSIHKGLTDEECQKLAINMSVAEYRTGIKVFIDTLATSEGILTDEEQRAILLGIYRIRMAKDHSTATIVSAPNRNGEPYSVETQLPVPPIDRRVPDGNVATDPQLALSSSHTRTDL